MLEVKFKITSEFGLHARISTKLVNIANQFNSNIHIESKKVNVNLKSIMGVMSLGVTSGDTITITIDGEDEKDALNQIALFIVGEKVGKEM